MTDKEELREILEEHHSIVTDELGNRLIDALAAYTEKRVAEALEQKLRPILNAHEMLMVEQNGRPDCKNCVLAETIEEQLNKQTGDKDE